MDLGTIISGLKTQGSKCNGKAIYEEARGAHEELAAHATSEALFAAMAVSSSSSLAPAARKAIVVVLVAEHRKAAHPLWQALLVAAFERVGGASGGEPSTTT